MQLFIVNSVILLGEYETLLFVSTIRRFIKIKWIAIRRVRIDINRIDFAIECKIHCNNILFWNFAL